MNSYRKPNKDYPLTHAQKRIYYDSIMFPGQPWANVNFVVKYPFQLDFGLMAKAINLAVKANDGLRLRLEETGSGLEPTQYVAPHREFPVGVIDFSGPEGEGELNKWIDSSKKKNIDLFGGKLFYFTCLKLKDGESGYYVRVHHLVVDGWSCCLMFNEINRIYEALSAGDTVDEKPNPSYIQYIEDESEYLQSQQAQADKEFWHEKLLPLPKPANLSSKQGKLKNINAGRAVLAFPDDLRTRIHDYCKANKTSPYRVVLSALMTYIAGVTGNRDVVIGGANHGRSKDIYKNMMGMFVSTFLLRKETNGEMTFDSLVKDVANETRTIVKSHQKYPYDKLARELRDIAGDELESLRNINFIGHSSVKEEKFCYEYIPTGFEASPLLIHLDVSGKDRVGILELEWIYHVELYDRSDIQRFQDGLCAVLNDALSNPKKKLSEISLISNEERNQVLYEFNDTRADYPNNQTIHQLIEKQAEQTPGNTAVTYFDSAKNTESSLTYRELNEKANQLAALLREKNVGPNQFVGLMVERSPEMIIGMLAILKAGGAYLPIAPDYPADRVGYLLEDSSCKLLLTRRKFARTLPYHGEIIDLDDESIFKGSVENLEHVNSPSDLCYAIYTSGSTGKPKGAMIEHSMVINLAYSQKKTFEIEENDRVLQFSSMSFDASVEQIYITLFSGATLVLADKEKLLDLKAFEAFIDEQELTHIHAVPMFVSSIPVKKYKKLKRMISGGDVCPLSLIEAWTKYNDFCNEYGPTETTVTSIQLLVREGEKINELSIGKALDNTYLYVLGKNMRPAAIGEPGELYIGGDGVGRGYMNRPELTANAFLDNPFIEGGRMYKTGDMARWLPDGNMEFLGRVDHQVKIRGFRIEPGEIENELKKEETVTDAVVIPRTDAAGDNFLCAYIVAGKTIDISALKSNLSKGLPDYMIPSYFMQIEEIPLTHSGKIDRKSLPEPGLKDITFENIPFEDETEEKMAAIWSGIPGIGNVHRDSDFFEVGGHSLKLFQLITKVEKEFDVSLSITQLHKCSKLKEMVELITLEKYEEDFYITLNEETGEPGNTVFCFPPIYGYGFVYKEIASYMKDHTFYSFNFIDGQDKIKRYADMVTQLQPQGPYLFFGWSAGGQLSIHVAKELERRGRSVSNIILFDTHMLPEIPNIEDYYELTKEDLDETNEFIKDRKRFIREMGAQCVEDRIFKKIRGYLSFIMDLELPRVDSHLHMVTAAEHAEYLAQPLWENVTQKTFSVYEGVGKHVEMLLDGFIDKNAEILKNLVLTCAEEHVEARPLREAEQIIRNQSNSRYFHGSFTPRPSRTRDRLNP